MKKDCKTFCPFPWIQLGITMDESVRVCCYSDQRSFFNEKGERVELKDFQNLDEYLNLPEMKDIRRKMLAGERPDYCKKCYEEEDAGQISPRQIFSDYHKEENNFSQLAAQTEEDGEYHGDLKVFDLFAGNHCNLKCRMCSPFFSSILADDFKQAKIPFDSKEFSKVEASWKADSKRDNLLIAGIDNIEIIKIAGGEPFVTQEHFSFLEKIISTGKASSITLSYNTNLTILPERLLKSWKHFKLIDLNISLDASNDLYDYIRHLGSWSKIIENLEKLRELKKSLSLNLSIVTVFQAYNAFQLTDLLEFLLGWADIINPIPHYINLEMPSYLAANIYNSGDRKKIVSSVESFFSKNDHLYKNSPFYEDAMRNKNILLGHLEQLIKSKEQPELYFEFLLYTKKLDRLRNQNVFDLIPELKSLEKV